MKITNDDFEHHVAKANMPNLTKQEYQETKAFLLRCQSTFTPPHTFIPRVSAALQAIEHHKIESVSFFQKPLGLIIIAGIGGVLTYGALLVLGWVNLPSN